MLFISFTMDDLNSVDPDNNFFNEAFDVFNQIDQSNYHSIDQYNTTFPVNNSYITVLNHCLWF